MSELVQSISAEKKRRPGRPRRIPREQVIEAALELFWKKGYATTTTRDLEAVLGLSQSSIYNEFGSKQTLLETVLDHYESITSKALLTPMDETQSGQQAIEDFFDNLAHWVTHEGRRGCMLINMMAEDGGTTESVKLRTRNYRRRVKSAFASCLSRAASAGEIIPGNEIERADLLVGLVLGFNIAARGGASAKELDAMLAAVNVQVQTWRLKSA